MLQILVSAKGLLKAANCIQELPSNAFGQIDFEGSSAKAVKYVHFIHCMYMNIKISENQDFKISENQVIKISENLS